MNLKTNIGVIAMISPGTLAALPELAPEFATHEDEISSALRHWQTVREYRKMRGSGGVSGVQQFSTDKPNPLVGRETYVLCGYATYFLTDFDEAVAPMEAAELPHVQYSAYITTPMFSDRVFRFLNFAKDTAEGRVERTAFALITDTDNSGVVTVVELGNYLRADVDKKLKEVFGKQEKQVPRIVEMGRDSFGEAYNDFPLARVR